MAKKRNGRRGSSAQNEAQTLIASLKLLDVQIAARLEVASHTVYRWRKGICAPRRIYLTLMRNMLLAKAA